MSIHLKQKNKNLSCSCERKVFVYVSGETENKIPTIRLKLLFKTNLWTVINLNDKYMR